MRYWWLNFGEGFDEHLAGGFIALPVRDSVGVTKESWSRLRDVQPGDIVLGFDGSALDTMVVVVGPSERGRVENEGRRPYQAVIVPVEAFDLPVELERRLFIDEIEEFFDADSKPWESEPNRFGDIHPIPDPAGYAIMLAIDRNEGGFGLGRATDAMLQSMEAAGLPPEQIDALDEARGGRGAYRERVLALHGLKCCLTGITSPDLLLVHQIKSWMSATNEERLDPDNALVLAPTQHAAFAQGLIAFDDEGTCIVSDLVDPGDGHRMSLVPTRSVPVRSDRQRGYLAWHRENVFR